MHQYIDILYGFYCLVLQIEMHTYTYIPRTSATALIPFVWWTISFWRGQPADSNGTDEMAVWDNFEILDGSSELWCYERSGILSIPQMWRKVSHKEHIIHVSRLTTSTKKQFTPLSFSTTWGELDKTNDVGCFQRILRFWHAKDLPMFTICVNIRK